MSLILQTLLPFFFFFLFPFWKFQPSQTPWPPRSQEGERDAPSWQQRAPVPHNLGTKRPAGAGRVARLPAAAGTSRGCPWEGGGPGPGPVMAVGANAVTGDISVESSMERGEGCSSLAGKEFASPVVCFKPGRPRAQAGLSGEGGGRAFQGTAHSAPPGKLIPHRGPPITLLEGKTLLL